MFERLTETRGAQARQLEAKFNDLEDSLIVYTRGQTTTDAIAAFTTAFDQLGSATISPQQWQSVVDYYTNRSGAAKKAQTGTDFDIDALLPTSNAAKYLQANYTAPFTDPGTAIDIDDARDGSPWSAANARFNDFYREIVQRFQFEDALLLDTRGNIVYSAYKGVDLGTNILDGPFSEDGFQEGYQKVLASNAVDFVAVTDFGDYQPADEPTAWMLAPAGPRGRMQGVLALQFPISKMNNLMTVNRQWEAAGMGQTGETILVGPDDLMRSDSRLFLTDPERYRQTSRRPERRPMSRMNRSGRVEPRWFSPSTAKPSGWRSAVRQAPSSKTTIWGAGPCRPTGPLICTVCNGRLSRRSTPTRLSGRCSSSPGRSCCPR